MINGLHFSPRAPMHTQTNNSFDICLIQTNIRLIRMNMHLIYIRSRDTRWINYFSECTKFSSWYLQPLRRTTIDPASPGFSSSSRTSGSRRLSDNSRPDREIRSISLRPLSERHAVAGSSSFERLPKICDKTTAFIESNIDALVKWTEIEEKSYSHLRFSPLNSLSRKRTNCSRPTGSWRSSWRLNAHRFTLLADISFL